MQSIKRLLASPHSASGPVTVRGWLRSARRSKNVGFLTLNDGSTSASLQAVLPTRNEAVDWRRLTFGASVEVSGRLVPSPGGKQDMELQITDCKVLGDADESYPLQKKYSTADHLRNHVHLRPRTIAGAALLRLQSSILASTQRYFEREGFFQTLPPVLTGSDCEGAGEVFTLAKSEDFFKKPTYLAVSTQLHLECLAMGIGRVWTLATTFRAEKSQTARHLSEFRMIEAELTFTQSVDDVMDVVEGLLKSITTDIATADSPSSADIAALRSVDAENVDRALDLQHRWSILLRARWPRISYHQAQRILSRSEQDFKFDSRQGLQTEHELYLTRHFDGPVFVTHYPRSQKPFYMSTTTTATTTNSATAESLSLAEGEDEEVAECFDLLVPGMGELCGGSLREDSLSKLLSRMHDAGMTTSTSGDGEADGMGWYTDLRKYGTVPHGGFGIGFERLVCYIVGVTNVREVAAFPRYVGHCKA